MTIEGRIAIDVGFTDLHTAASVQTAQRIALAASDAYTSGKVAVVTGTITTAGTTVSVSPVPGYVDAAGQSVLFSDVTRVAYQSSRDSHVTDVSTTSRVRSSDGQVAVGGVSAGAGDSLTIARTSGLTWSAGTASYTLVLYGS